MDGAEIHVLCFGESSGAITVNAGGGVAPYIYTWTPAIPDPDNPIDLPAGDYTVVAKRCLQLYRRGQFLLSPNQLMQCKLACTQTGNVSLPGMTDGEGTVNIMGGIAPYTISWTPGGSQGQRGCWQFYH